MLIIFIITLTSSKDQVTVYKVMFTPWRKEDLTYSITEESINTKICRVVQEQYNRCIDKHINNILSEHINEQHSRYTHRTILAHCLTLRLLFEVYHSMPLEYYIYLGLGSITISVTSSRSLSLCLVIVASEFFLPTLL